MHAVDGREPGADGAQRRLPGLGRQHGVGIEPHGLLALGGARALDPVDVALRMRQRDLLLDVVAQRRLLALEALEQLVGQHLVDGAHAVGPLGMAGAGVVLDEAGWVRRSVVIEDPQGCQTLRV